MKNKLCKLVILLSMLISQGLSAADFGWYGFVLDGSGNSDTKSERVYEYNNENPSDYYYCIHAAVAGALNIRLGKPNVTLTGVHNAFSLFSAYQSEPKRSGSLSYVRQLSFPDGKIPGINAVLRQIPKGDGQALFQKVKDAVKDDYPVVVAAKQYRASLQLGDPLDTVTSFSGDVGHALLIVGYIELDTFNTDNNLVAVRDPFLEQPVSKDYSNLFDYTVPVWLLKSVLQATNGYYDLMIFKTDSNADLKMMVTAQQSINATSEKSIIDRFAHENSYLFGDTKSGSTYDCYSNYVCQDYYNGTKIAVQKNTNIVWYYTSSWVEYGIY